MTMTLFVLFGSSIRLLAADKGAGVCTICLSVYFANCSCIPAHSSVVPVLADEVFDVLYSLCFVSFILEFLLMSWSKSAVTFPDALPPRLLPPEPLDTASEDGESTKSNKSDSNYQQRGTEMPSSIDTVARRPRPASLREQPLEQLLETRMTRASSTGSMATNGMNYNKLTIFRSSSFLGIPAEFSGNEEQDGRSESTYEPPVSFFGRISSCVDGVHLFIMKRWPAVWYYSCCCSWLLCGSIYRLCGYANNIQVEGYLLSFYWYLDLLSIVSLFPDVSWVARGLGLQVDRDSVGTEVDVVYAGRVFRLVRLVRVVRLFKVIAERWRKYAHTKRLAKLVSEGKMCVEEAEAQAYIHDNRQSKLGARLSTTITQKVFLMILILAVVLPFLFYNHGDDSATYAIETLHLYNTNTSLNNATKLAAVSSIVNSTQRSDNMFSYLLRLEVTPLVDGYVVNYQDKIDDTRTLALTEITRRSFDSNGQEYVTSGVFTNALYIYIEALNTILLIISVAIVMICGAVFFTSDVERLVLKPIERMMAIVEVVASDPLSPLIFQTDNGENGHSTKQRRKSSITSSRRTKSPKNSIDGYRSRGGWKGSNRSLDGSSQSDNYSEYSNYGDHSDDSGADDDSDLYESGEDSSPEIDPRRTRRNRNSNHRSWRYSYRKSRRLSKEYSRLSLLSNENPRHASSKGHLLKTKLSSRKLELYASNTGATYETRLLESTIQKITGDAFLLVFLLALNETLTSSYQK